MTMGLFDLTGKVALVTGGNGGIGLGMARGLAMHGASVIIWGNKPEKNEEAVAQLRKFGGEVRCRQVDVSSETAVQKGIAAIIEEFGCIDQAIANAGIGIPRKDMFDISAADFRKLYSVNVEGVFFTLREAARHMILQNEQGRRGGSLVSVGSTSSIHGAARNEHLAIMQEGGGVVNPLLGGCFYDQRPGNDRARIRRILIAHIELPCSVHGSSSQHVQIGNDGARLTGRERTSGGSVVRRAIGASGDRRISWDHRVR